MAYRGRELSRTYTHVSLDLSTPLHQEVLPQQNCTHAKLARHPWMRCARLSDSLLFCLYLPASPVALTTSRAEALQARRSCARDSLETFTQSFLHRAWPKTRCPKIGSRSALIVVALIFSWPPACLRHVRDGVGRRRSLISSPSGRLAV